MEDNTLERVDSVNKYKEADLSDILNEIKHLNEINNDLSTILNQQNEQLNKIETIQEDTCMTTEASNELLENVAYNRFKLTPIVVGGVIGAGILGPGAFLLGAKLSALYFAAGGGMVGIVVGKQLS